MKVLFFRSQYFWLFLLALPQLRYNQMIQLPLKLYLFIYLFINKKPRSQGRGERKTSSFIGSLASLAAKAKDWAKPKSRISSFLQRSHLGSNGPTQLGHFCCFSKAISRQLAQKQNGQGTNQHPYRMLASQAAAFNHYATMLPFDVISFFF